MNNSNQSFAFTQGGQTQIHKMRMLKQVALTTFHISILMGMLVFLGYYFYTNYWMNILMYPFWALAEFMQSLKGLFPKIQGFTFYVDIEQKSLVRCSDSYFLSSSFVHNFIQYLNYHLLQGAIYAGYSMMVMMTITIVYFMKKGTILKNTKHIDGLEIEDLKGYKALLKKEGVRSSLMIDQIPIPREAEVKHFMISGTTGSGKSNMINHLLKAIETRGDKAVVLDTTGAFVEKFYNKDRDVILNPFDERGHDWCLWSEPLSESYEFDDLAESLISKHSYSDPFWENSAKQSVAEMLRRIGHSSCDLKYGLDILLSKPIRETGMFFKDSSISAFFSKDMEKVALTVRATLSTQLNCLYLLKNKKSGFSINNWIKDKDEKGILFIHGLPKQRAQLRPLWSLWFNIAIKSMMDLKPDSNRRVWFIVDELASLNKLPCLDMALAEGRKYGACIVLGFQNMAQIQGIYGAQGSKSLSELMVNKFLFQAVDFDNAKMLAHFFGDKQILESHENVSFGANEIRDGVSLTHRKKLEPIIRASHLMELSPLHFYARIAAQKCCLKGDLSYFESLTQAEAFIPSSSMDDTIMAQKIKEQQLSTHDNQSKALENQENEEINNPIDINSVSIQKKQSKKVLKNLTNDVIETFVMEK